MQRAERSDWNNKALSSQRITIDLTRRFTENEMNYITMGVIPEAMEDKWFIYWQDDTLYFHRSWTGVCIYMVRFKKEDKQYTIFEADIDRDPEEYKEEDTLKDIERINYLIDRLLLNRQMDTPYDNVLANWSFVGRVILEK